MWLFFFDSFIHLFCVKLLIFFFKTNFISHVLFKMIICNISKLAIWNRLKIIKTNYLSINKINIIILEKSYRDLLSAAPSILFKKN